MLPFWLISQGTSFARKLGIDLKTGTPANPAKYLEAVRKGGGDLYLSGLVAYMAGAITDNRNRLLGGNFSTKAERIEQEEELREANKKVKSIIQCGCLSPEEEELVKKKDLDRYQELKKAKEQNELNFAEINEKKIGSTGVVEKKTSFEKQGGGFTKEELDIILKKAVKEKGMTTLYCRDMKGNFDKKLAKRLMTRAVKLGLQDSVAISLDGEPCDPNFLKRIKNGESNDVKTGEFLPRNSPLPALPEPPRRLGFDGEQPKNPDGGGNLPAYEKVNIGLEEQFNTVAGPTSNISELKQGNTADANFREKPPIIGAPAIA